jgi:hypothetical protein
LSSVRERTCWRRPTPASSGRPEDLEGTLKVALRGPPGAARALVVGTFRARCVSFGGNCT